MEEERFERGRAEPVAGSGNGRRFIFVGGAPRSGTTLMQNMLDSHPGILGGPEFLHLGRIVGLRNALRASSVEGATDAFAAPEAIDRRIRALIEDLLLPLADRHAAPLLSEKTPSNVLVFGELVELFPQARCIFVLRDPRAVVASMLAVGARAAAGGRRAQPFTRSLRAAVRHVGECLEAGFAAAAAHPGRILTVTYEALVTEPEAETRRICGFLGLDWDPAMLAPGAAEHLGMRAITATGLWYDADSFRRDPDPDGLHKWRDRLTALQAARVAAAFAGSAALARHGYGLAPATPAQAALGHAARALEGARERLVRLVRAAAFCAAAALWAGEAADGVAAPAGAAAMVAGKADYVAGAAGGGRGEAAGGRGSAGRNRPAVFRLAFGRRAPL
jgi:hypothetical protein